MLPRSALFCSVLTLVLVPQLPAQTKSKLARKSIEIAARKLRGKTAEKITKRAVSKTPIPSLARGNRLARKITAPPAAAAATLALNKHGRIVDPLIKQFGPSAAQAYAHLNSRNARRLAMLRRDGLQPNKDLLKVIARYGDPAMDFIWKNKAALATASVLAAFLASPEPFLDGLSQLSADFTQHAIQPVATGVAAGTNWTLLILIILVVLFPILFLRAWFFRLRHKAIRF